MLPVYSCVVVERHQWGRLSYQFLEIALQLLFIAHKMAPALKKTPHSRILQATGKVVVSFIQPEAAHFLLGIQQG